MLFIGNKVVALVYRRFITEHDVVSLLKRAMRRERDFIYPKCAWDKIFKSLLLNFKDLKFNKNEK